MPALIGNVPVPGVRAAVGPLTLVLIAVALSAWSYVRNPSPARRRRGRPRSAGQLVRLVLTTMVCGYAAMLALVGIDGVATGEPASFFSSAATGGALLAFGMAAPAFLVLELAERWIRPRLRRRRGNTR